MVWAGMAEALSIARRLLTFSNRNPKPLGQRNSTRNFRTLLVHL